jgi:peptide/nickel transport system substrate-binding protein
MSDRAAESGAFNSGGQQSTIHNGGDPMSSRKSVTRTVLFALVLFSLVLSACAQPTPTPAPPPTKAPAAAAPTQAPAPTAVPATKAPAPAATAAPAPTTAPAAAAKKRLVVGLKELVTSFDTPYDWAIVATWIHSNISDCLVWRDRKTAEFVPWLAESWENVNDTTWRIKLKKGVKFTNGEPFNATAAKFTIDRILADQKALVYNQWTFIKEIKIVDDFQIEVITAAPEPAFLSKMAGTGCQVVPPKYYQEVKNAGYSKQPIGTGPYKLVEWIKDDRIVLAANPDYFQGKPAIDEIVFRAIPEDATRVSELLTGGADMISNIPIQDWKRVEANTNLALDRFITTQTMQLMLRAGPFYNADKGWGIKDWTGVTQNPKIRQAIAYAIDRKALIELIGGMGVPTLTRITPPTLGVNPKLYNTVGEYNPAKAKQLMQEAGYKGETITFHSTQRWPMQKEVTEAIGAMLTAVGFKVDMQIMELTVFNEQVYVPYKNKELYMESLGNSFFDPWITVLSERSDRRERSGWPPGPESDEVDKLIRAAAVNMNKAEREKQYQRIAELIMAENGGPIVFLYQMKDTLGRAKKVAFEAAPDGFLWLGKADIK